jgi:hypothetical protein
MQYKNQDVAINLANDLEFLQKENIVIDVTPYHLMAGWLTQLSTQLERVRGDVLAEHSSPKSADGMARKYLLTIAYHELG